MKKNKLGRAIKSVAIIAVSISIATSSFAGWSVNGSQIIDPNGNPFVFRGVTIDHTLAPEKTVQALNDIATLGANSAQIEFAIKPLWISGEFPRKITLEIRDIIKACKDNKLVCVLEVNDASGYSQAPGSLSPSYVASYWGLPDMQDALRDSQSHIIIGFSNQLFDSNYTSSDYAIRMQTYLSELKSSLPSGFLVMIDGNKWGQDTDKAMLAFATQNKPYRGTYLDVIYSIDLFDAYTDPVKVHDYIASFAQLGAPLVVGGFAPGPYYHPHNIGPRPDVALSLPAQSVMQYAEQYGTGYFGWSWSGVQNLGTNSLTSWGNLLFNDPDGIRATAKIASIYNTSSSSGSSSSSAVNHNPVATIDSTIVQRSCGTVYGELNTRGSFDPDGDALTYEWTVAGDSRVYSGPTLSYFMRGGVVYTFTLTVKDGKGGVATANKILRHEYTDYCISSSSRTSISTSSASSIPDKSSSSIYSSSSIHTSISSSVRTSSSSSIAQVVKAQCSYVVQSQWDKGFTGAVRIKNSGTQPINGWSVNWQYGDGSKITGSWNATLSGTNPYTGTNLNWNAIIQPGQTVEFGFQGSKPSGNAIVPIVSGNICK